VIIIVDGLVSGADTEKLERHIFRMYDSNKDGHIDFREFMIVLYIMSNGSPEENLKQIFRVFDINNDGTITLKELQKIVKDLFLLINETNADKASQEVLVKTAFHEMDENHDGAVTQSEFIEACMAQKKFSTMLTLKIIDVSLPRTSPATTSSNNNREQQRNTRSSSSWHQISKTLDLIQVGTRSLKHQIESKITITPGPDLV